MNGITLRRSKHRQPRFFCSYCKTMPPLGVAAIQAHLVVDHGMIYDEVLDLLERNGITLRRMVDGKVYV